MKTYTSIHVHVNLGHRIYKWCRCLRAYFFPTGIESVFNSDESSSGWENSDSAMESSDEEEDEKMEEGGEESDEDTGDSSEGEESSSDNGNNFSALGLFGPDG